MNRDDIIRMAKQASGSEWSIFQDFMPELERFATLVAAAEREACARVCEELPYPGNSDWQCGTLDCAAAIRARGE